MAGSRRRTKPSPAGEVSPSTTTTSTPSRPVRVNKGGNVAATPISSASVIARTPVPSVVSKRRHRADYANSPLKEAGAAVQELLSQVRQSLSSEKLWAQQLLELKRKSLGEASATVDVAKDLAGNNATAQRQLAGGIAKFEDSLSAIQEMVTEEDKRIYGLQSTLNNLRQLAAAKRKRMEHAGKNKSVNTSSSIVVGACKLVTGVVVLVGGALGTGILLLPELLYNGAIPT